MVFAGEISGRRTRSRVPRTRAPYNVEIADSFKPVLDLWSDMAGNEAVLPFQRSAWLKAWSATFGREPGTKVVAATIYDAQQMPVMALPLVRRRATGRYVIAFADDGVADYNAPILSRRAPNDRTRATQAWCALRRALPPADVIRLEKMPLTVGLQTNPLALIKTVRPSSAAGLAVTMNGTYEDWRSALPRRFRMELGRCARLFDSLPGARFRRVDGDDDRIFTALEDLQRARIQSLGLPYILDEPVCRAFYRRLADGPLCGPGVLTALTTDDGVLAVLFGLRYDDHFVMLRIGAAAGAYTRFSPARHLIVRTMERLRMEGIRSFDFGLGDYPYKRKLGGEPIPLCDLVEARSIFGLLDLAEFRLKSQARANSYVRYLTARPRAPRESVSRDA